MAMQAEMEPLAMLALLEAGRLLVKKSGAAKKVWTACWSDMVILLAPCRTAI